MKKNICLTLVLICGLLTEASAQKEAYNWLFGDKKWVSFVSGEPQTVSGSAMVAPEGCASISDAAGNLLFYTHGESIWNRQHEFMSNGLELLGSKYSTQSSIILKKPKSESLYYLFTTSGNNGIGGATPGIRYHIIDMDLDGGKGRVISKNNFLLESITEKLTATFHENGKDVWVVTRKDGQTYAFLLTENGIETNPSVSGNGIAVDYSDGSMKLSPSGTKLAVAINATTADPSFELYDFDKRTGLVSNVISKNIKSQWGGPLPPEFGSRAYSIAINEKYFYVAIQGNESDRLSWSVKLDFAGEIKLLNFWSSNSDYGSYQVGPSGVMYCLVKWSPNASAEQIFSRWSCLDAEASRLEYKTVFTFSATDNFGLTNFNDALFRDDLTTDLPGLVEVCNKDNTKIGPIASANSGHKYEWFPRNNLSDPFIANPIFQAVNETTLPDTVYYKLVTKKQTSECDVFITEEDSVQIIIHPTPRLDAIAGESEICALKSGESYHVNNESNYTYTWSAINGTITSGDKTHQVTVDWGNRDADLNPQIKVSVEDDKGCKAESIKDIVLHEIPEVPIIQGSKVVCPNTERVDYTTQDKEAIYEWDIEGGEIYSNDHNTINVNWGNTNFNSFVAVRATNEFGCISEQGFFRVKVKIQLEPELPAGMDSVCFNFRAGVPYRTSSTTNSTYTWQTNGGVVSEGQGSFQCKLDWFNLGEYKLWVKEESETTTDYCSGVSDTLRVVVFKDLASISMEFVSTDFADDGRVKIQWDVNLLERVSDLVIIYRRQLGNETWEEVTVLTKDIEAYIDNNLETDSKVFEYKIEGFNKCNEGLETVLHNTILLSGESIEEDDAINLFWNDYTNWQQGVERYEIWRKLDKSEEYKLVNITEEGITDYTGKHGADGFEHVFRVKAKSKDANVISWSNDLVLSFRHDLVIPNVITPNGDDKNEYFTIPKLELYPNSHLEIYNRNGKAVYEQRDYKNSWNGENLSSGIYYYLLRINNREQKVTEYKGWLHILR